ncbi:MAG: hypothetical protein HY744_24235 [Deltaproteobacteria bacterium]|nr:hypothetical protein [Deltaproteobacteria bacterium]
MLRIVHGVRRHAPSCPLWLRALVARGLLAVAVVLFGAVAAGSVAGCADEQAPETHVDRLKDPIKRTAAVTRLIQFYEDAMTKDKKNREGPNVKPLLDKIVPPLVEAALAGDLDRRSQGKLYRFLADSRDVRAAPAIAKALTEYRIDDKRLEPYDNDIQEVVRAVGRMKLKEASKPLLELFVKLRADTQKGGLLYRDVYDAMVALADLTWESRLVSLLDQPINSLKDVTSLRREVFWQTTAAMLLGNMKAKGAVRPLVKVILAPLKADIAATAMMALLKIGRPSVEPALKVLSGEDQELVKYCEEENLKSAKDKGEKIEKKAEDAAKIAYVSSAAIIVGSIGRQEAVKPMIDAIEKADDMAKVIIARELPKLPKTPEAVEAVKKVYEKTSLTATIPPGLPARETLLEAMGTYFDHGLLKWMVDDALALKGEKEDISPIQSKALEVALKLMKEEDVPLIDKLSSLKDEVYDPGTRKTTITPIGKAYEEQYKIAKSLLQGCRGKGVECFVDKVQEPASQAQATQFQGIKAAYMIGVLGDESTKDKIVGAMPKLSNAAVRFVAVSVLDRFSPGGDKALAEKLQAIVDKNEASRDQNMISADAPVKQVIPRLRARVD